LRHDRSKGHEVLGAFTIRRHSLDIGQCLLRAVQIPKASP